MMDVKNIVFDMNTFLFRNEQLLKKVDRYVLSAESKRDKNQLLLCMSQIKKVLKLLIEVSHAKEKDSFGLKEIIKYLTKRLEWCTKECERVLSQQNDSSAHNNENCGGFVQLVDRALLMTSHGISPHDPKSRDWKQIIEDILCQALTIAGISEEVDSKEITASCHKVLSECNRLEKDCQESDTALHSDFLADWLLQLERRVNTALLRLVLKTFSDFMEPLKMLILAVDEKRDNKSPFDLDEMVDRFDQHSDCIHHLALFALACSEYSENVLKIRCCLASLESLDDSLVPAAVAAYLDPKHHGKKILLKFLVSVWMHEVELLEKYLDCLIDPIAFAAVTLESIDSLMDDIETKTYDNSGEMEPFISIVLQASRLERHLRVSLPDLTTNLNAIIAECKSALDAFLKNENDHHNKPVTLKRVISRFKLLLNSTRKISGQLSADLPLNNDSYQNTSALLKDMSFPDSIQDLPIDISAETFLRSRKIGEADMLQQLSFANLDKLKSCKKSETAGKDDELLDPYKLLASEKCLFTNTLYAPSPRRVKLKGTPLTALRKLSPMQFEQTMALDLTDILERFTNISDDTLSTIDYSSDSVKSLKPPVIDLDVDKGYIPDLSGIGLLEDTLGGFSLDCRTFSGRTDGSSVITIDRLNDLKKLEDRIEYLKEIVNK